MNMSCSSPADGKQGKTITVEGEVVVAGDSDMLRRAFSNLFSKCNQSILPITPVQRYTLSVTVTVLNVMITNTMSGLAGFPLIWNVCLTGSIAQISSRFYNTEGAGLGL